MLFSQASSVARIGAVAGAVMLVASCGGGGGGGTFLPMVAPTPPATVPPVVNHSIGGTVTGLEGRLVLQNNAGDDLQLSADGKFTFATTLVEGSDYKVSIRTQPLWQFCTVTKDTGKASADVSDVTVACSAAAAKVETLAGSGSPGAANGKGTAASFLLPYGIALTKDGGLLIGDWGNNLVRKISPEADVTTFAGNGNFATVDGNGTAASFEDLTGLTVDATDTAFVADAGGHRIRKITPTADVTTVAGNGTNTTTDGNGTAATFNTPVSVAVDAVGNLYVLEYGGGVVRKITPTGDVTTLAGSSPRGFADGTGTAAKFGRGYNIAIDASGNLYVADSENHRIRKITPAGVVTTLAGTGTPGATDGPGNSATFSDPRGVAVDAHGNVYVADFGSSLLRRITPAGVVSTLAGQKGITGGQDGIGAAATFAQPLGLTINAAGTLYVADTFGNVIRKVTPVRAP
ncbi:Serine/threonine-protein kinase PknD [Variovorax boronicumulans]|uniref:NHL repeat-containing protein n=1 Tax=Variovorax boronicumulans TaxID=436515 RepID=UPI000BB3C597|nr:NHL repeat-containing protein [Variovorax boronicumulans]PBI95128.1 Serine/threonine-protein kinase PknD [Variovorax boronicumulans]